MAQRIDRAEAHAILHQHGGNVDFYRLDSETVQSLHLIGKSRAYREPRNANGSYARMFHAHLVRRAASKA
jgi:hypothetical protein